MKKILLSLALAFLAFPILAHASRLVGVFGHGFTDIKDDPVFTVKDSNGYYQLRQHGDESTQKMNVLTAEARRDFWAKMWWEQGSSEKADCLGNEKLVICFVPQAEREKEPDLKAHQSDYFYYDPTAGVMEIAKISD